MDQARECWLREMTGDQEPPQPLPNIHLYGGVTVDEDELACARPGPKIFEYPTL